MNLPNILFLADTSHHTKAVQDHINAITGSECFNWHVLNPLLNKVIDKLDLTNFDAIGLHYSVKPYNHYYLSKVLQRKIAEYQGTKFLFLQDEFQRVNHVQSYLHHLGFHVLFTLVNPSLLEDAYPDPRLKNLKKINVLTGYVSDDMQHIVSPRVHERTIDVSYRGRQCEYWLGSLAHEKITIAEEFIQQTQHAHLNLDISTQEQDRVYGENWLRLLMNSRAVLGTESGASIWDFDESIKNKTNAFLKKHKNADFQRVYQEVLKPYDGKILYNAISPRVFEAAATRTPMIMFPGFYSGVCQPDEHYIVLEKDFSNIDEVVKKIKDLDFLQALADQTHRDLIASNAYSQQQLADLVGRELSLLLTKGVISKQAIDQSVHLNIQKNKYLNALRCFFTEIYFIAYHFLSMLFDPKQTTWSKLKTLSKGFKRYVAYLLPRLKRARGLK